MIKACLVMSVSLLLGGPARSQSVSAAGEPAECADETAPEGMVCVPGGKVHIGSDSNTRRERPAHQVRLDRFFIDEHEVTNAEYRVCERAGECRRRTGLPRSYRPYLAAELPAVPISWPMAHRYCVWAGKRLPTEAEWESVARGGGQQLTYPWGNEAPTCSLANYKGCGAGLPHSVGTLKPGAFGVHDMAGNGYEWVSDWASDCYAGCRRACGEACAIANPQGPCFGSSKCPGRTQRVLKGGSWYWPATHLRGSWRRAQRPQSGLHRFSFRCASDTAVLAAAPYWHERSRDPQPDLEPPTAEQLNLFGAVEEDTDVLQIKECSRDGKASHTCRDPLSYYRSNEQRRGIFGRYIKNLGGGYVGIGADQSYDFIASARSRWAWIFDYDPTVVRIHYIIRAVVSRSETPANFLAAFHPRNLRRTKTWVRDSLADDKRERRLTLRVLDVYRGRLFLHYRRSIAGYHLVRDFGWLADDGRYSYIRTMLAQGRVMIRKGNLLTDVALPQISASAQALGIPVRVFYPSNADDQWDLTANYRNNLGLLPFDEQSVVIRTMLGDRWKVKTKWLYTVHSGLHMQRHLRRHRTEHVGRFIHHAQRTRPNYLRLIGLPQAVGRDVTAQRQD